MRRGALCLCLCLCLVLTGCGGADGRTTDLTEADAALYVEGLLKETYLGEYDPDYLRLVDCTESQAREVYEAGLEADVDWFLESYGVEYPTEELREELRELYVGMYALARFQVVSAARQSDGSFSVKLTVEPVNVPYGLSSALEKAARPFCQKYPPEEVSQLTEEEARERDKEWAALLLEVWQEALEDGDNLSAQSITVQLEQDKDGNYAITQEDLERLDSLIVDYSKY